MGQKFIVYFENVAISAVADLIELGIGSSVAAFLHEVRITKSADVVSEQLRIAITRYSGSGFTNGSGGTTGTQGTIGRASFTSASNANVVNTSQCSGTEIARLPIGSNLLGGGCHYLPIPELRLECAPGDFIVVSLDDAPAASMQVSGYLIWEEIG